MESAFSFCVGKATFLMTKKLFQLFYCDGDCDANGQKYKIGKRYSLFEAGKLMDGWKFYGYTPNDKMYRDLFNELGKESKFDCENNVEIFDEDMKKKKNENEKTILQNHKEMNTVKLGFYFEDDEVFFVNFKFTQSNVCELIEIIACEKDTPKCEKGCCDEKNHDTDDDCYNKRYTEGNMNTLMSKKMYETSPKTVRLYKKNPNI